MTELKPEHSELESKVNVYSHVTVQVLGWEREAKAKENEK